MTPAAASLFVIASTTIVLGYVYFRRWSIARPPIGVVTLDDIAVLLLAVLVLPYVYLALPTYVVLCILAVGIAGVLDVSGEPLLPSARVRRVLIMVALVSIAGVATLSGAGTVVSFAANDIVIVAVAVGGASLWAQSGLRARDTAILAAGLAVYDAVFTGLLPTTADLFGRLAGRAFAPLLVWPAGPSDDWLALGLGDLLVLTLWPLVLRKAFGRTHALIGLGTEVIVVLGVLLVPHGAIFPVMVVVGPLTLIQYVWWRRNTGVERTTREYLLADA